MSSYEFGKAGEKVNKRTRKYSPRKYKPKGYKDDNVQLRRTRMISTRVDEYTLAKILLWVTEQGIIVRSQSELVYLALTSFANLVEAECPWEDVSDAREYINSLLGDAGALGAPYAKQLQMETAARSKLGAMPKLNAPMAKDFDKFVSRSRQPQDGEIPVEQVLEIQQQVMERLKREKAEKEELMRLATEGSMTQANGSEAGVEGSIKKDED